jgi:F0F1-type ATP synthase alpha subunit
VTGQVRLDLGNPLTQGNFIFFKGTSNTGKTQVAMSTIREFVKEDKGNRAVYVGLTKNSGDRLLSMIDDDELRQRVMALGVDSSSKSYVNLSSDAEYILAPNLALKATQDIKKTLIVFDDVVLHQFKEKQVYDQAG